MAQQKLQEVEQAYLVLIGKNMDESPGLRDELSGEQTGSGGDKYLSADPPAYSAWAAGTGRNNIIGPPRLKQPSGIIFQGLYCGRKAGIRKGALTFNRLLIWSPKIVSIMKH